ncbi:N2-methylguanosine tRNA methyltransferase [Halovenus aranensis]|uniref:tRNA (guanine(10)-N(2))-dimethyltransferase n=1 Tax=Halovenus aranensis TaxID=890420 RepID=A0A1G8W387_9EURY|nr:TIGR01177 family methyltransferase [Halovenus aranensis]SDJ72576.1 N2-methylguanosine tRNA methyltransferase [Halovenus aranensis]
MYVLELAGQDDRFAAYEARSGASDVSMLAPGLATARAISGVAQLAFTHRAGRLLGRGDPTVEDARAILRAARLEREGSVAVRAVDVRSTTGVDTQAVERALGNILVERGFAVDLEDPDHELRALFSAGDAGAVCALGWLAAESTRDFTARKPSDRPFFQPGSMDPMLARALVNVAGAGPDARILDPMCGTGGLLIEAGLVGAAVVGADVQPKMLRGSGENLAAFLDGGWALVRGSADALALTEDSVDGVVFDTPYGRQSKIEGELETLVADALGEARRVAPRCVVVGDRSWESQARSAGWTVDAAFERRVHKSLTRHVLVLVE